MQSIFNDERQRTKTFSHGPSGWIKIAPEGVENAQKWVNTSLRFSPIQERFWLPTQATVNARMGSKGVSCHAE